MSTNLAVDDDEVMQPSVHDIAIEVADIISRRLKAKDLVRLLQIVFLDVEETAELLRVKPATVSTWISKGLIPVRYAGGRPVFLLCELLNWTLPENDKHVRHRLTSAQQCKMAVSKLSIGRERRSD
jgi:Helix-turn-helix domain